jgi:uncharacterized circularly permuted ATP-grasp superfamily protein/uncharacterized alpha-E superfamily protein
MTPGAGLRHIPPGDEMVDGGGRLRPQWSRLLGALATLGPDQLASRARTLDALAAEEGARGLLPGAGQAVTNRRLDPVPIPLSAAEFAGLERGLAQRARLLDAVLRDVYGPQALLAEGLLPPALVFANPAFLRPCRASGEGDWPGGQRLHLYAADLIRAPDGRWRVLADRTADAAGIGYAMLNRRALARVMPELFRAGQVRRLRPFFELFQDRLQRLGGGSLAILTPGPSDKLWFEHLALSRELSCALVEGGDLTARDGALYLKTLRGLRRVDVLIRRQDGRMVDPLELEPGAMAGVPGLMDAARTGGVRIVNDPGTGLAEAPGFAAFLPALSRRLLGEELLLPSVPTLWLGDAASREEVFGAPGTWRLRPALDGTVPATPLDGLDPAALASLQARIARAPGDHAAMGVVQPSLAPWVTPDGRMEPRPVAIRLFLLFDGEGWRALPGGLARALSEEEMRGARLKLHAPAKDVWISAEEEDDAIRGPADIALAPLAIRRSTGELPSRVADNFFWLGRYLERLEAAARLLRTAVVALERPTPTPREMAELKLLAGCLAAAKLMDAEEAEGLGGAVAAGPLAASLLRAARDGGRLPAQLAEVSRLAFVLRDRLTGEVHDTLSQGLRGLSDALRALPPARDERRGLEPLAGVMTSILTFCAAVSGLAAENMVRGGGRLFLDLGRRIERAWAVSAEMARLLDEPGAARQPARLEPGLRLALELRDSVITYRSRYLSVIQPAPVLDLVLADEGNPRGLAFQLRAARDLLAELADGAAPDALAAVLDEGLAELARMVAEVAASPNQAAAAAGLPARLRALEAAMAGLSDQVARRYFALLPAAHSVGVEGGAPTLRGAA